MSDLRQSTAVTLKFGTFVDDTDGKTAETGLTIQKADVRLSKNGGDMAAASANQGALDVGAAHDELGYYDISLDTTDTNTIGRLRVMVSESGALPVWADYEVLSAAMYDWLYGTVAPLAPTVAGRTLDVTATGNAGIDWNNIENQGVLTLFSNTVMGSVLTLPANIIAAATLKDDAITKIQANLATSTALATVDGIVDSILEDTGTTLPATLAALPAAVWAYTTRTLSSFGTLIADIWTYVTRSLTDKLGFGLSAAYDGVTITVQSPVTADGDAVIDQGYDYYAADDRELSWTDDNATWPDLTGATVELVIAGEKFACTVATPSGPATITLELSAEDTNSLGVGLYPFVIKATLVNTHTVPLLSGYFTVRG